MPVYLYTFHACRSWMPDHRRGYVKRGQGVLKPDPAMAQKYRERSRHERAIFDDAFCEMIERAVREACSDQRWRLHAVVIVWSHLHVLLSWQPFRDAKRVRAVLRRGITTRLRDWRGAKRPVLSRYGSIKRVRDKRHFEHHMKTYLPGHGKHGGRMWFETRA